MAPVDLTFIRHRPRRTAAAPPAPPVPADLTFIRHRPRRPRPAPEPPPTKKPAPVSRPPRKTAPAADAPPAQEPPPTHDGPALTGRTKLSSSVPTVTIGGRQARGGALHLTLGWSNQPTDARSARAGLKRSTDVHLGCLWEMNDSDSGVVQSLGEGPDHAPGHGATVLRLGPRSETQGETITVALAQVHRLKRLVLFAYAYSRRPEWGPLAPVLVAEVKGATIEMRVDREAESIAPAQQNGSICVLASIHRVGGDLVVRREAEMFYGQQAVAAGAFGWDLAWADGRTVPPPRTVR
ncbi:MAG TPA: hypothetical protein VFD41_02000 [Actinomycetales bacterium]|nr:hypothetical protein [Actinomycetales bacterium]